MLKLKILFLVSMFSLIFINQSQAQFKIKYEKYKLANGLEVILHEDKSDPIVSVAILYHVGSNRETKGRTGFAHLFEHIMFQESQHIGQDQFFKKIQKAGGTLNGGTSFDQTIYFEVLPKNALEMALWMEADRMGFLLSKVTQEAFENQQNVVQNEKRQRVDNQPYGHIGYIQNKLLYNEDHPYNWQVIGEMEDLGNATLQDVHNFYKKWYGPNNATLVVAGDYDKAQTKKWIEKYYGEIKSSEKVIDLKPIPTVLTTTKRAYYEDNFAKSPELNIEYPTVERYNKDAYALNFLSELFSSGKKSPLYKVIVEEKKLAPSASAYNNSMEVAGTFGITIRTFPDKNLGDVEKAVFEAFDRFEKEGFTDKDLKRVKAKIETRFYNGISSILGKSFQLASYNEFAGSPDFITKDLNNLLAVTKEDIWNVYNKYIKNKNYVIVSCVPKGKVNLVAENSELFKLKEESITEQGIKKEKIEGIKVDLIPTKFDRTKEPIKGPDPSIKLPKIWNSEIKNGMKLYGIEYKELPLVQFSIIMKGGMILDENGKIGTANLLGQLLTQGTKNKTPIELEEAIEELGSTINVYATNETMVLTANCLSKNFDKTFELAKEILLEPRFDEKEFARLKNRTIENIKRNEANPAFISNVIFNKVVYGKDCKLAILTYGTLHTVNAITIDDLKNYYKNNLSPKVASLTIVGNIGKDQVIKATKSLEKEWTGNDVVMPEIKITNTIDKPAVYFIDFENAKQSEVRVGSLFINYTDEDYFPATVVNQKLGGSFNGILNIILREEKGFTYGARSNFSGSNYPGTFVASTAVQSNATLETSEIIRDEIVKYCKGISDEDMNFTKDALIKSNALRFETLSGLNSMLNPIAVYGKSFDYIKKEEDQVRKYNNAQHVALANKYLDINKMVFVIAGDGKTQLEPLKKLGYGDPIVLDKEGNVKK